MEIESQSASVQDTSAQLRFEADRAMRTDRKKHRSSDPSKTSDMLELSLL